MGGLAERGTQMKCPNCNGTGKEYSFYDGAESVWKDVICPTCNGTGKVEQTNEEWFATLSTEEKATFLAVNKLNFDYQMWIEWLKEIRK